MPVPYLNYSINTSLQTPVPNLNYSTNTSLQTPVSYLKYTMTTSFETPVPCPLHHNYLLPNASAIISTTPQTFPSKFQCHISTTPQLLPSEWQCRIATTQLLPNASAISQLHHDYFIANNFQFTDCPISKPWIVQVSNWRGI